MQVLNVGECKMIGIVNLSFQSSILITTRLQVCYFYVFRPQLLALQSSNVLRNTCAQSWEFFAAFTKTDCIYFPIKQNQLCRRNNEKCFVPCLWHLPCSVLSHNYLISFSRLQLLGWDSNHILFLFVSLGSSSHVLILVAPSVFVAYIE